MIKVDEISLPILFCENDIKKAISNKLKIDVTKIKSFEILKQSIDARRKPNIKYICSFGVCLKDNLEKELTNINDLTAFLYIDNTASSDIEYVCRKCYEIKRAIKKFVLILDFENQVPYTKKELEQLRGLSLYLDIHILITTDLASVKNKKYPALEDLDNADLVEIADKILLSNDEKSSGLVLAKNNFGKIGLLCND